MDCRLPDIFDRQARERRFGVHAEYHRRFLAFRGTTSYDPRYGVGEKSPDGKGGKARGNLNSEGIFPRILPPREPFTA
jgi:hypothetical protein